MYLVLSGDFFPDRRATKNVADRIVFIILDPYRLVFSQRCSDDTLCYRFVVLVDHIQYLGDDGGRCPFRSDRIYPVFLVDQSDPGDIHRTVLCDDLADLPEQFILCSASGDGLIAVTQNGI